MSGEAAPAIVLYDGVCALCNGFVRFLLRRDAGNRLRFASLQGAFARALLARHGRDPRALETVYVVVDEGAGQRLLSRSDAVVYLLRITGSRWLAAILGLVPRVLREGGYGLVVRLRYRLFGRYEACPLPEPRWRDRFIEDEGTPPVSARRSGP